MKDSIIDLESSLTLSQMSERTSSWRGWMVCLCASLFFFYEFIQMNMFNAISTQLMQTFNINAYQLGRLSAFYFISNVIFLFPAGMLLDRYSTRKIILGSLAICIFGTAAFSMTSSVGWAMVFRFLTGIGSAFCFLSVIRLTTRWFPSARLALVTGVVVTMAMLGGIAAQTPLTLLTQIVDWRNALLIDAVFGVIIFFLISLFVQDYPADYREQHQREKRQIHEMGYWTSIGLAFLKLQNWFGGLYSCFMNLPISLLGGIWGVLYLTITHHIPKIDATYITSMLFFGTVVGGPLAGWISDSIGRRRLPMLVGAFVSLMLVLTVMLVPNLSFVALLLLFFAIGLTTSTQIIGYPTVAENSLPAITAMSVSVVNITTMSGQAIFQPLFGALMDKHVQYLHHVSGNFLPVDFHWAMLIFPLGFIVAGIAAYCLRESYCHPRNN